MRAIRLAVITLGVFFLVLCVTKRAAARSCADGPNGFVFRVKLAGNTMTSDAPACVYEGENKGEVDFGDAPDHKVSSDGKDLTLTCTGSICTFTISVSAESGKAVMPKLAVNGHEIPWAGTTIDVKERPSTATNSSSDGGDTPESPSPGADATFVSDYFSALKQVRASDLLSEGAFKELCGAGVNDQSCKKLPSNVYYDRFVGNDVAIIFYDSEGKPRGGAAPQFDEDDTVLLVVSRDSSSDVTPTVTGCTPAPEFRIGGDASGAKPFSTPKGSLPPFLIPLTKCSSDTPISVNSANGAKSHYSFQLSALELHRITIGLSLIYDFSLSTTYSTSPMKGENVPVISRDDHVRGLLPPIVTVSLRPYKVDSKRVRFGHRFVPAPTIGVSLTEPTQHLFVGLLGEFLPGIGLLWGYHFHQEQVLTQGYQTGDRVSSGAAPTTTRWADPSSRDWFLGLTFDALVLTQILGKL